MKVFRLVQARFRDAVLSGQGASFRHGARWNRPGQRAVYTSENRALAVIETLAHMPSLSGLPSHVMCEIDVDDAAVENALEAPSPVAAPAAADYGSAWFRESRSVALAVPSIIVPEERNVVLNAAHPEFESRARLLATVDYPIDERLRNLFGRQ